MVVVVLCRVPCYASCMLMPSLQTLSNRKRDVLCLSELSYPGIIHGIMLYFKKMPFSLRIQGAYAMMILHTKHIFCKFMIGLDPNC